MATPTRWSASDFQVNTTEAFAQGSPNVTGLKDGTFLVVWADASSTGGSTGGTSADWNIRGQIFNADGTKKGGEFIVNGTEVSTGTGTEIRTVGSQDLPKVAVLSDGRFVVTWVDGSQYGDGTNADTGLGIRARIFNADGTPSGGDFWVNTTRDGDQYDPSIAALSDGGFVISYTTTITGSSGEREIKAQAFDAAGNRIGGDSTSTEISVNTTTISPQKDSAVVGLNNGNYAVFYTDQSWSAEDPRDTVRGRIFNAQGVGVSAEFIVPSSRLNKEKPAVTLLANGRFVVTWTHVDDTTGDGSLTSVKAQIFNPDGSRYRGEFLVNSNTFAGQSDPSIVALPDGGFAVSYTNGAPPFAFFSYGVATFDAEGNKTGQDLTYNLPTGSTASGNLKSSLAVLADGRLVLSWGESANTSSSRVDKLGVYAQILEPRDKGVTVAGKGFNDDLIGTKFADNLSGSIGQDRLAGDQGDDLLIGGVEGDTLDGGMGSDTASYAGATASVTASLVAPLGNTGDAAGDVYVSIENLTGTSFADQLTGNGSDNILDGGDDNDILSGGGGLDKLLGGKGDDALDGGTGADTLNGGLGNDTYIVDNADDVVEEAAGGGTDRITASVSYVLALNSEVEELRAAPGLAAISLTGNAISNKLYGNAVANTLDGAGGADYLEGGAGNDVYIIDDLGDTIVEAAGTSEGVDSVVIGADFAPDHTYDLSAFANVEAIKALNSAGSVNLIGNIEANSVTGNDSANELRGGNDAAADTLTGGKGNDSYFIHDENDIIVEVAGEGTDTIFVATAKYELSKDLSIEVLKADVSGGIGNFMLTGNNLANTITGADGNDVLDGGGSADGQADTLVGGAGNDVYIVRHEDDVVTEAANAGDDKIIASISYVLRDSSLVETIEAAAGTASISLTGNSSANTLLGNDGISVLEGRGGDDFLDGGAGLNTAVFTGMRAEYTITKNTDGTFTVADNQAGRDSTDTLKNIRYVRFSDEIVDLQGQTQVTLSIAATDAAKVEGDTGVTEYFFVITRSTTSGTSSVKWSVTGIDAGAGTASAAEFEALTGTETFLDGENQKIISIRVRADKDTEGHETFTVSLSDAVNGTIGTANADGMIINDDSLPVLSIAATDAAKDEGSSGTTEYTFTVSRSNGSGISSAAWKIVGTGADPASGADFDITSGTVQFADGEVTKTITVRVIADTFDEEDETFAIVLSNPTGATIITDTAYGTISNDDDPLAVNTAPSRVYLTSGGTMAWADENKAAGQVVATVTADDDNGIAGLRYSMTSDVFEIDAVSGQIKVKGGAVLDFESGSTYTVAVTVTDTNGTGLSTTQNITINLNDVNEKATGITFGNIQVLKVGASGIGAHVASAAAVDPDASAEFSMNLYRFDNGQSTTPDGLFVINANTGEITVARAITAQDVGVKTLNVVAYDASNPSLFQVKSQAVTIVAEDNGAPTSVSLSKTSIDESSSVGSLIGSLSAFDPDGAADIAEYTILKDDDDKFMISGGELRLKNSVDHEAKGSHSVTIRVRDKAGNVRDETFTIFVNDASERPGDIIFNNVHTLKVGASGAGAHVATAEAVDPDAAAGFTANLYRFESGQTTADGLFTINSYTGEITTTRALTAEDAGSRNLSVVTYDANTPSLFHVKTHTVTIAGPVPVVQFSSASPNLTLNEGSDGGWVEFTYTLMRDTVVGSSIVAWALAGTGLTDADVEHLNGTATFAEGSTTATITVRVRSDRIREADEPFTVTLSQTDNGNAVIGGNGTATGTIVDDDILAPGMPSVHLDPAFAATQTIDIHGAVRPFKGITFSDAENDVLTVKISFAKSNGDLVIPEGLEAFFDPITGIDIDETGLKTYTFTGAAEELRVVMDVLQFDAAARPSALAGSVETTKFTIEVTDAAHAGAPGDVQEVQVRSVAGKAALSGGGVQELSAYDAATGAGAAGTLTAKDEYGNSFNYELTNSAGGRFKLVTAGGVTKVVVDNGLLLDHEQAKTHTIQVKVNVAGVGEFAQNIVINVEDVLSENAIGTTANDRIYANIGNDILKGLSGNDILNGGVGHDTLMGDAGNDYLNGGAHNDKLYGGAGNDKLYGSSGKDIFVFNTRLHKSANVDLIGDFNVRDDSIQLENAIFRKVGAGAPTKPKQMSSEFFTVGTKAEEKDDYIVYDKAKGFLYYDADGSGKAAAVLFAKVKRGLDLTSKDFFVI